MKYLNSIYESNLSTTEIAVYLFLKDHSNKKGESFHSKRSIAEAINKDPRTVQRCLRELERLGFVKTKARYRSNGGQTSNLFTIF